MTLYSLQLPIELQAIVDKHSGDAKLLPEQWLSNVLLVSLTSDAAAMITGLMAGLPSEPLPLFVRIGKIE